jgi:predicted PurR-regulated permease PerM
MSVYQRRPRRRRGSGLTTQLGILLGTLVGFSLLVFIGYQLYQVFQAFVAPVAWAIILRFVFQPVHARMPRFVGGRPNLVAFLSTLVVMLAVGIPAVAISGILTSEAVGAIQEVKRFIQAGGVEQWGEQLRTLAWIPLWEWLSPWLSPGELDLKGLALRALNTVADFLVEQMTTGAANLLVIIVKYVLMLLTLFFVFRDGEAFYHWVRTTIPLPEAQQARVFERLAATITAVTYGIGITAIVQGILAGAAYWVLGVPFPAFWGLLTSVVAPIPLGGTGLVWVPAGVYLILAESWARGIVLLAWGALVVSTIDNVLKTVLISERTRLPPLLLFFAILGGLKAYGVLGVFLGPLLLSFVITGITLYRELTSEAKADPEMPEVASSP